jgi:hydroxyacyl-ACP dehydratase HTD2-like protein with hotdog domain
MMAGAEAAQQMLRAFEGQTRIQRQVLDGHQLQKLSLTLNRPQLHPGLDVTARPPPQGTPLPPGYHLVYFSPASVESELGADGTDRTFNAPAPFSRRMWAGGSMTWTKGATPLRVGDEAEERTRLVGAAAKQSRDGSDMVLVDVEKEFWGPAGLALVDRRAWVFRPPPPEAIARSDAQVAGLVQGDLGGHSTVQDVLVEGSGELVALLASQGSLLTGQSATAQRRFQWSPVGLFRFSALTFNGHMIHYNEGWTRNVEGHPATVVHGPLNLIAMMDYWRDFHGAGEEQPANIHYRALSPLYAGDEYVVRTESAHLNAGRGRSWDIVVARHGTINMRGTISAAP